MASVASLAARYTPAAGALNSSRRASNKNVRVMTQKRTVNPARASSDDASIPPTNGPGGFSGSKLIVPGMEGFDAGYGNPNSGNKNSNPMGGRPGEGMKPGSFPGGYDAPPKPGSEKKEGEAFAPFRPPSEYLDQSELQQETDQMSFLRLRQRAGNWFELAPLFPKLMRNGFTPDDIFDETGVEPKEQSLWTTWTASRYVLRVSQIPKLPVSSPVRDCLRTRPSLKGRALRYITSALFYLSAGDCCPYIAIYVKTEETDLFRVTITEDHWSPTRGSRKKSSTISTPSGTRRTFRTSSTCPRKSALFFASSWWTTSSTRSKQESWCVRWRCARRTTRRRRVSGKTPGSASRLRCGGTSRRCSGTKASGGFTSSW
jgi:hypothetical protein